jgi:hypothetical protein
MKIEVPTDVVVLGTATGVQGGKLNNGSHSKMS